MTVRRVVGSGHRSSTQEQLGRPLPNELASLLWESDGIH
ncbi:hypothetical protein ABH941_001934 [Streptacidiphilus sp. EB103A]